MPFSIAGVFKVHSAPRIQPARVLNPAYHLPPPPFPSPPSSLKQRVRDTGLGQHPIRSIHCTPGRGRRQQPHRFYLQLGARLLLLPLLFLASRSHVAGCLFPAAFGLSGSNSRESQAGRSSCVAILKLVPLPASPFAREFLKPQDQHECQSWG